MHGLYLLWWVQECHISPPLVAAVLAAGDIAVSVFEIPTGWLADRCGYRLSLMAGSGVQVAGMLICWLGRDVPGMLVASLLVALGDAFRSGADEALLYRSCTAIGRGEDFQKIEATAQTVRLVAMVGLVLAGGAIVERWGFGAGWIVSFRTTPEEVPDRLDYIKSQPSWTDRPLEVFYGLGTGRLTTDHAPSGNDSVSGGMSAQQIVDALGRFKELGITSSSVPIPPVKGIDAYLDHAQWVIEEVKPKL